MSNRWERTPWLCRLGLHRWRRRPQHVEDEFGGGIVWFVTCRRCPAERDGAAP